MTITRAGVGQSAPLYRMSEQLIQRVGDPISACQCEAGCPSCVGPMGEVGERGKEAALKILGRLLQQP